MGATGSSNQREGPRRIASLVLGSALWACLLGLSVDLITANLAVEYFSIHHPKVMESKSPWLLAIYWGLAGSWWAGAIGGALLACLNERRGEPRPAGQILCWVERACVAIWGLMMVLLLATYLAAELVPAGVRPVTFASDRRLMAVAMAHQYEYWIAAVAWATVAWKVQARKSRR